MRLYYAPTFNAALNEMISIFVSTLLSSGLTVEYFKNNMYGWGILTLVIVALNVYCIYKLKKDLTRMYNEKGVKAEA